METHLAVCHRACIIGRMSDQPTQPDGLQPRVQSFILADHVYVDVSTGKKVIAGTFNEVRLRPDQTALERVVYAYLAITNCRGRVALQLRHVDLNDDSTLRESGVLRLDTRDPLRTYEVVMDVPHLPFPHSGFYALEACCNGQRIASIRLHAVLPEGPGQPRH